MRCRRSRIRAAVFPLLAASSIAIASIAAAAPLPPHSHARTAGAFAPLPVAALATPSPRAADPLASGSQDGSWKEFGLLQVSMHAAVYDHANDRLLAIGGTRSGAWALPLGGPPAWQPMPQTPGQPWPYGWLAGSWEQGEGLLYYPARGMSGVEVWSYDPSSGTAAVVPATGTPPLLLWTSVVADPAHHRLVLVGGQDVSYQPSADVWALDLLPTPTWSQLSVAGGGPGPLYAADLVLDPVRNRVVVLNPMTQGPSPGVFALALDGPPTWTQLSSESPAWGASVNGVAYDAAGDQILALGPQAALESFSLATNNWSPVIPVGPGPPWRTGAALVVDSRRHRLLVSGGVSSSGDDTFNDVWALSLAEMPIWSAIVPNGVRPPIRGGASDGFDPSRNRLVVFGGSDQMGTFRNDTWSLAPGSEPSWSPLATSGPLPPPRYWGASDYDTQHDRLVVFGGYSGDWNHPLADLWTLSFAGGAPTWSQVVPPGPAPQGRTLASLVYDPYGDRFLLLFGESAGALLDDVWELRLSPSPTWRQLSPTGTAPVPRGAAMAACDPLANRVIVFGGGNLSGMLDELWSLELATANGAWVRWNPGTGPSARNLGQLKLDTRRNRLLLFGGYGVALQLPGYTSIEYLNDSWALSLTGTPQWVQLAPGGVPPSGRDRANGAYDPAGDQLVITCGGTSGLNDTWALSFMDFPTPAQLALQSQDVTCERAVLVWAGAIPGGTATAYRRAPGDGWSWIATLDADGEGRVRLEDRDIVAGTTLEYRLGVAGPQGEAYFGAVTVAVPLPSLRLAGVPAARGVAFAIQLPGGTPADLALYDVTGRRVWRREVGSLGAGAHTIADPDLHLPPALYFARLSQGSERRTTRIVLAR